TISIRKFPKHALTLDTMVRQQNLSPELAHLLRIAAHARLNILISGGTGSGKTTLLNAVSQHIDTTERIITIEDAVELRLQQPHVVQMETRPPNIEGAGYIPQRELVRNALRMRPDRIIVGEVRGPETVDMLQAMNTGHDGSLSTIHSNSPRDALARLETLVLTAGVELPLRAIREQIASAFDLIVYVTRLVDGSRRVTHITEVLGLEGDVITLQDLFHAPKPDLSLASTELLGELVPTGLQPSFLSKLATNGVTVDPALLDPNADLAQPVSLVGRRS
ncbi:MAG: CpaF family protein, partial [Actinobacteria bacterium]|nr:CpaF family protein [Actinomycetota bacterium]